MVMELCHPVDRMFPVGQVFPVRALAYQVLSYLTLYPLGLAFETVVPFPSPEMILGVSGDGQVHSNRR